MWNHVAFHSWRFSLVVFIRNRMWCVLFLFPGRCATTLQVRLTKTTWSEDPPHFDYILKGELKEEMVKIKRVRLAQPIQIVAREARMCQLALNLDGVVETKRRKKILTGGRTDACYLPLLKKKKKRLCDFICELPASALTLYLLIKAAWGNSLCSQPPRWSLTWWRRMTKSAHVLRFVRTFKGALQHFFQLFSKS